MCARIEMREGVGNSLKGMLSREDKFQGKPWSSGVYFQKRQDGDHIITRANFKRDKDNPQWAILDRVFGEMEKKNNPRSPAKNTIEALTRKYNQKNNDDLTAYAFWMKMGLSYEMDKLFLDMLGCKVKTKVRRNRSGEMVFKVVFSSPEDIYKELGYHLDRPARGV